jgi:ankyrin repeat protein
VEVVQALAKAGADIILAAAIGRTATMEAALEGHVEVVQALAAAGADINATETRGMTATIWAARMGRVEAVQALADAGAAAYGNTAVVSFLDSTHSRSFFG